MITTLKITRIWVEDIAKVEVKEPISNGVDFAVREISIWTTKGEKIEFNFVAETAERLEFKNPDESWLSPKCIKAHPRTSRKRRASPNGLA